MELFSTVRYFASTFSPSFQLFDRNEETMADNDDDRMIIIVACTKPACRLEEEGD